MSLVTPCSLYYVVPFGQRWRTKYVVVHPIAKHPIVYSTTYRHHVASSTSFARAGFRPWAISVVIVEVCLPNYLLAKRVAVL
jgi:hypothetical protein